MIGLAWVGVVVHFDHVDLSKGSLQAISSDLAEATLLFDANSSQRHLTQASMAFSNDMSVSAISQCACHIAGKPSHAAGKANQRMPQANQRMPQANQRMPQANMNGAQKSHLQNCFYRCQVPPESII